MKNYYFLSSYLIVLLMITTALPKVSLAQEEDDPRIDQIPQWYIDQNNDRESRAGFVVTIDGYDNFFLGTDYAEGHISENPRQPGEYFCSFNIDKPHYTMDGFDWEDSDVTWGTSPRGDVLTAYDSLGNLYYQNMYGSPGIQGCKVVISSDNGQTWGPATTNISGADKNWIIADQTGGPYSNYVYTTMTASGYNSGVLWRSADLGVSWTQTASFSSHGLPGMMVCVGPEGDVQGGSVYVVGNSGMAQASTYTFYRSLNGGSSFSQMSSVQFAGIVGNYSSRHSVNNMRTRPYPMIAADNSYGDYRGRLYLVYAKNDPPGSGNKPDIWCRYSDNGGSSWSSAIIVNDDPQPQANHQWQPAVWCDNETGRLYVQWMDSREDPTSDSAAIYATYSETGGESFAVNQRVSNGMMRINCTTCGGGGSPRYQGDYNGIVSNPITSMSCWTDFRDGRYDSYAGYFPDYAVMLEPEYLSIATSDTLWVQVPDVKLYDENVIVNTVIEQPTTGSLTYSYPNGFMLTSVPGNLPVVISASGGIPPGEYDITITTKGPNGTPKHIRTAIINVVPTAPPVAEEMYQGNR